MAHDTARVSPRLHQTHENWEASHDFPRFSDVLDVVVLSVFVLLLYSVAVVSSLTYKKVLVIFT